MKINGENISAFLIIANIIFGINNILDFVISRKAESNIFNEYMVKNKIAYKEYNYLNNKHHEAKFPEISGSSLRNVYCKDIDNCYFISEKVIIKNENDK